LRGGGEEVLVGRIVEETLAAAAVDHGADVALLGGADEFVGDVRAAKFAVN
jgi:hypothetical protein